MVDATLGEAENMTLRAACYVHDPLQRTVEDLGLYALISLPAGWTSAFAARARTHHLSTSVFVSEALREDLQEPAPTGTRSAPNCHIRRSRHRPLLAVQTWKDSANGSVRTDLYHPRGEGFPPPFDR